jgi:hypothetical protein
MNYIEQKIWKFFIFLNYIENKKLKLDYYVNNSTTIIIQ